ncbi:MAG: histidine phosphatase family protein [Anaerolineales bacterium]|nr:histidine phosphatase family protein [Anaerolineales bacterium]
MSPSENNSSYIFTFLRHGESTGNAEKRHQGQADFPLTKLGSTQIKKLADYWEKRGMEFDLAISSPLSRAKESAEIISKALKIELIFDPIWMERDNGELAGLPHEEAMKKLPPPDFIPLYQPIAGTGESQWELFLRAGKAINQLMKNPPGRYLIISHGGLLNMVMLAAVGLTPQPNFQGPVFRFSNAGYTTLKYLPERDNWIVQVHNTTYHLNE